MRAAALAACTSGGMGCPPLPNWLWVMAPGGGPAGGGPPAPIAGGPPTGGAPPAAGSPAGGPPAPAPCIPRSIWMACGSPLAAASCSWIICWRCRRIAGAIWAISGDMGCWGAWSGILGLLLLHDLLLDVPHEGIHFTPRAARQGVGDVVKFWGGEGEGQVHFGCP